MDILLIYLLVLSLFFSDFIHTRTDLTQKISDIQQQLKQLPHGKLIISHNGENIKWYSSDGHSKKYIPKSDRALAEQLALRKYLTSLLEELLQEKKETSLSKAEWTKIYNAQNIVETEQLVEMLKQNGIAAFSQEAGANVAMHGAPGFGIYGVDIFVKTDDAEKAVQLIKEINNQENEENF